MSRLKKDPLRPLTDDEAAIPPKRARSKSESATRVARAGLILAVARGWDYQQAAGSIGRRPGDPVAHRVARFNAEGLAALDPRHGGGRAPVYDQPTRERILRGARRQPTPEADGTASWGLTALQEAPRSAPDGLPEVSTYTIWRVPHEAGASPQKDRSWCPTGTVPRNRGSGTVVVTDPDATPETSRSRTPTSSARRWASRSGAPTRPGRPRPPHIPARRASPGGTRRGNRTSPSATARPR